MPFNSESGRKAGKSSKRGTSRINDELKSKLRSIINESIETINISCLMYLQVSEKVVCGLSYVALPFFSC